MHRLGIQFKKAVTRVRGFTLIETLVAVLLLVTAISGPLTLASKGLSAALVARDQMIAFYLAQDAVEYVRFVRDSNKLAGSPWLNGLSDCTGASGCTIDQTANPAVVACVGACQLINKYINGTSVSFGYNSSGTPTPQQFRRTVTLTTTANEAVLTVAVSWRAQSGVTRTISVRENLFDWQ